MGLEGILCSGLSYSSSSPCLTVSILGSRLANASFDDLNQADLHPPLKVSGQRAPLTRFCKWTDVLSGITTWALQVSAQSAKIYVLVVVIPSLPSLWQSDSQRWPCRFPCNLHDARAEWGLPQSNLQCWGRLVDLLVVFSCWNKQRLKGELFVWCSGILGKGQMWSTCGCFHYPSNVVFLGL